MYLGPRGTGRPGRLTNCADDAPAPGAPYHALFLHMYAAGGGFHYDALVPGERHCMEIVEDESGIASDCEMDVECAAQQSSAAGIVPAPAACQLG